MDQATRALGIGGDVIDEEIMLNFLKAFDTLNRSILIDELFTTVSLEIIWDGLGATCQIEADMWHRMVLVSARSQLHVMFLKGRYLFYFYSWFLSVTYTQHVVTLCL